MKNIFENIGIIFISTLTFFILIEIFSYSIFKFYYSLKIDDQRNPIQYSDETISKLYETNKIQDIRSLLEDMWNREQIYEPLVEHIERPYVSEHLNISSKGYRLVKNQKDFIDNQNVNLDHGSAPVKSLVERLEINRNII